MTVSILCRQKPEFSFHYRDLARRVIEAALDEEKFSFEAEVSVVLTGNEEIRRINRETRGIDAVTDVLSFPMLDYETPADFSFLEEHWEADVDPDTGEIPLGDIVLSVEKVRAQAKEYGHSERREYAFLIAHSMLHLMGYDHMDSAERAVMEEHQRRIMDILQIHR